MCNSKSSRIHNLYNIDFILIYDTYDSPLVLFAFYHVVPIWYIWYLVYVHKIENI